MQLGLMYSLKERGLGSSIRAMSLARVLWFSEMMEPPQNQALSMKRATCQGHWFSSASNPPTILSFEGGPSIPQVACRSTLLALWLDLLWVLCLMALASWTNEFSAGLDLALTRAWGGVNLERSRAAAGLQCSSGLRLRPLGRARAAPQNRTDRK